MNYIKQMSVNLNQEKKKTSRNEDTEKKMLHIKAFSSASGNYAGLSNQPIQKKCLLRLYKNINHCAISSREFTDKTTRKTVWFYSPRLTLYNHSPRKFCSQIIESPRSCSTTNQAEKVINDRNVRAQLAHTVDNDPLFSRLPVLEPSKSSNKKIGIIKAFSANTHQGLVRYSNVIIVTLGIIMRIGFR